VDEQERVTLDELRAQCLALEPVVLRAQLATAEELTAHKPGGSGNPQGGALGWLRYLIVLQRRHSVLERGKAGRSSKQDADLTQILAGEPEFLILSDTSPDGKRQQLAVHPKSARALLELHKIDRRLAHLAGHLQMLRDGEQNTATLALTERTLDAIAYYTGLCLWALNTPGPKLPWGRAPLTPDLAVSEQYLDIAPIDIHRFAALHQHVNNGRLQALEGVTGALGGVPDGGRPSFSIFMGVTAMELGVSAEQLFDEWSLGSVFASAHLAAGARADTRQAAETAAAERAHR